MPKRPARMRKHRRARVYLHVAAHEASAGQPSDREPRATEAVEGLINFGTIIAAIVWFLLQKILLELVADKIAEWLAE
ncbi:hypothetical protein RUND412_004978, partial [Rhizina undulata]